MKNLKQLNLKKSIIPIFLILLFMETISFATVDANLSYIQQIIDLAIDSLRYILYAICGITSVFQIKDTKGELSQVIIIFIEFYIKFACINGIEGLIRKIFQSGAMILIN